MNIIYGSQPREADGSSQPHEADGSSMEVFEEEGEEDTEALYKSLITKYKPLLERFSSVRKLDESCGSRSLTSWWPGITQTQSCRVYSAPHRHKKLFVNAQACT